MLKLRYKEKTRLNYSGGNTNEEGNEYIFIRCRTCRNIFLISSYNGMDLGG